MPWKQGVAEDNDGAENSEEFSGSGEDGAGQRAKVSDGGEDENLCVCVCVCMIAAAKHTSLLGLEPSTSLLKTSTTTSHRMEL